jgi:hypothetical protein
MLKGAVALLQKLNFGQTNIIFFQTASLGRD